MKNDREQDELLGLAQSLYVEMAEFTNEDGKLREGPRMPLITVTYDIQGTKTGEFIHSFMYTESDSDDYVFSYDTEGKVREQSYYRDGVLQTKVIPSYDTQARVAEALFCNSHGTPAYKRVLTYDAQGNPIEMGYYKVDGSLVYKYAYTNEYDSIGNLIKVTALRWVAREDKSFYEPTLVTYRTIIYY
jgi:hypothetical protein